MGGRGSKFRLILNNLKFLTISQALLLTNAGKSLFISACVREISRVGPTSYCLVLLNYTVCVCGLE